MEKPGNQSNSMEMYTDEKKHKVFTVDNFIHKIIWEY